MLLAGKNVVLRLPAADATVRRNEVVAALRVRAAHATQSAVLHNVEVLVPDAVVAEAVARPGEVLAALRVRAAHATRGAVLRDVEVAAPGAVVAEAGARSGELRTVTCVRAAHAIHKPRRARIVEAEAIDGQQDPTSLLTLARGGNSKRVSLRVKLCAGGSETHLVPGTKDKLNSI